MENIELSDKEIEILMDKYLKKELSEEDRVNFEEFLAQNPQMQTEISLRRDIIIGIHAAENRAIRNRLEIAGSRQMHQFSISMPIVIAATIAFVAIIALFLIWIFP